MNKLINNLRDIWYILSLEIHRVFSDKGVILIFFVAGIIYPILYSSIYNKENLSEVPIAVVDLDQSTDSKRFIKKLDATPDVKVAYHCINMEEAKRLFEKHQVHGILYFPSDYNQKINSLEQAYMSLYCDMSSFLFYRAVYISTNMVMLDEMKNIELRRYNAMGITGESAEQVLNPIQSEGIPLFSPSEGFRSFLLPVVLILILHQTLFFGITVMCGTAYEEGKLYVPKSIKMEGTYRVVIGRALAYFLIYSGLTIYGLILIPHLFDLPHMGNFVLLTAFAIPFLLATIFFSMTVGSCLRNREATLLIFPAFTIILMFLSGFAWPTSNIPSFWKVFSYLFPSTFGIQGYIAINTMGASFVHVTKQIFILWLQAGIYFITSCASLRWIRKKL